MDYQNNFIIKILIIYLFRMLKDYFQKPIVKLLNLVRAPAELRLRKRNINTKIQ